MRFTVKLREKFVQLKRFLSIRQVAELEGDVVGRLERAVARLSEELEQQKTVTQAVTGENLKIRKEFEKRVAELSDEVAAARLMGAQVAKIGEAVKRWQEQREELEARLAGFESFQRLLLEQPDEAILELIKNVKRQLKEQAK